MNAERGAEESFLTNSDKLMVDHQENSFLHLIEHDKTSALSRFYDGIFCLSCTHFVQKVKNKKNFMSNVITQCQDDYCLDNLS
jgi:hypothetical protein